MIGIVLYLSEAEDLMTHVITDRCIGTKDTACIAVCPVDCIHPLPEASGFADEPMLYINPETCIDCMLCVDVCPVSAIFHEDDLPPELVRFVRINAEYFQRLK